MFTRRAICAGLTAIAINPVAAYAHREAKTHTSIIWNSATKFLDITHTYHIHDAATSLAKAGILERAELQSLQSRAKLALYTDANFSLVRDGSSVTLDLLGADYEGQRAYVFQQVKLENAPQSLEITCRLLQSFIPEQVNDVDVNINGTVQSVRFKNGDKSKIILA